MHLKKSNLFIYLFIYLFIFCCSGYMAPEYVMHGQFSVKSDVFSFGILVLEILSGKKNNYLKEGEYFEDLTRIVSI